MQVGKLLITTIKWVAAAIAVAAIVISIRQFCIASYCVSTNAMEEALHKGDYILVNKLPFESNPERNNVVLFSSPLRRDSLIAPLFLSRCIGLPGDTITVTNEGYVINGTLLPYSPMALNTYFVSIQTLSSFMAAIDKCNIPVRNLASEPFGKTLRLTNFEEYQLREELTADMQRQFVRKQIAPYEIIVPAKGRAYRLTPSSIMACKEAILSEAGDMAKIKDGKLIVDGKETDFFFFNKDYYWMLSDNTNEAIDSRHLGLVPRENIVGSAWLCWYSHDKKQIFKTIK